MRAILDKLSSGKTAIEQHFQYLHQHPGLAFEETAAASYIAGKLREWGYEVTEGLGKTGVVGQLKVGDGKARIGLRADTDALPVQEGSDLPYKSRIEGTSHMCGHDAHSAMLLGAAEHLARTRKFNGTLNLIFHTDGDRIPGGLMAFLRKRVFSAGVVFALGFLVLVSTLTTTAVEIIFANVPSILPFVGNTLMLVIYSLAFALLYHYLPDRRVRWRQALFGGVLTSILFVIGRWGIGLYITHAAPGSACPAVSTFKPRIF